MPSRLDDLVLFKPPSSHCKYGFTTCIKGVVQKFPYHRGRSFNNLTGSYSLGDQGVKQLYLHGKTLSQKKRKRKS